MVSANCALDDQKNTKVVKTHRSPQVACSGAVGAALSVRGSSERVNAAVTRGTRRLADAAGVSLANRTTGIALKAMG
jgi:predicted urease superfamily metal-dependent hydrolase